MKGRHPAMTLADLPRLTREELDLHGLALPTDLLSGAGAADLELLRRGADKARCPILALIEPDPLPMIDRRRGTTAVKRAQRVLRAAERLGCSSAGIGVAVEDGEESFEAAVEALKRVMETADGVGVNLLLRPAPGLTVTTERLTELIKRVGGFRIGTMPDFLTAAESGDPGHYLRRLAPYASVVVASADQFTKRGGHRGFDLAACVAALNEVGYDASLAIEYRGAGDLIEGVTMMRQALAAQFEDGGP